MKQMQKIVKRMEKFVSSEWSLILVFADFMKGMVETVVAIARRFQIVFL